SLNVPAVHSLRKYGPAKLHSLRREAGMTTLTRPASDYGLSLILGGAEGTLYEIASIYAGMAASLNADRHAGCTEKRNGNQANEAFPLRDRTAIFCTFEALKEVNRPDEMDWRMISSVRKVAWKTGTSFGFRDAWAVGVTPDYAVGVWAGNAQGQGSPGLTGARTAGPVMFDIFNLLPASGWFEAPGHGEYITAEVCRQSGHLKGQYCEECDTVMLPKAAMRSTPCPYHVPARISGTGQETANVFILPPAMEWYYKEHHPEYRPAALLRHGQPFTDNGPMAFIYPENGSTIMLPRQLDGTEGDAVFNLAHSNPDATIFWHLDNKYIGSTRFIHQLPLRPSPGRHTCTAVDGDGNSLSIGFSVE
ncbi:MAG: penicillin-binding protein 1C, partial [Bacteroidales bacterium]|nr:penicillin-binding protein 1C [Bacteroidales bacterium]